MRDTARVVEPGEIAPEIDVVRWFNTSESPTLDRLRGRVVVLYAFQMLCRGCVLAATPLAQRVHERFAGDDVTVLGLHTVFEHHDAMTPVSLAAYLHEFGLTLPIGVDRPTDTGMPATMSRYGMRGTPTWVLIDRDGVVRAHAFGAVDELMLGATVAELRGIPA